MGSPSLFAMIEKQPQFWKLIRRQFPEGIRYLLQRRFTDASKPYWLTRRIYRARRRGLRALAYAQVFDKIPKNEDL